MCKIVTFQEYTDMTLKRICDTKSFISNALMVYLIIAFMNVAFNISPTVPNVKAIGQLLMEIL